MRAGWIPGPVNTSMEQSEPRVPFRQAALRIEKLDEFEQFRSALARIFAAEAVEDFLRLLQRKGVPIRDFDRVLRAKLLERADRKLAQAGKSRSEEHTSELQSL